MNVPPVKLGPNHKSDCDGMTWRYSGSGYNRVRVCACGAEDHTPDPKSLRALNRVVLGGGGGLLRAHNWVPGNHVLMQEHCGRCGAIKRTDGGNSPFCKGTPKVGPR